MEHILDQLGKGVAVYPSVWHHAESCLLANRRPKGWLLMAAEFLKTFPMLEDVLIEDFGAASGSH